MFDIQTLISGVFLQTIPSQFALFKAFFIYFIQTLRLVAVSTFDRFIIAKYRNKKRTPLKLAKVMGSRVSLGSDYKVVFDAR